MQWGREHEEEAILLYENVCRNRNFSTSLISINDIAIHDNLEVQNIGLCVSTQKPWYGASPDAVMHCTCCGYRVLEVKCPYSLAEKSLSEEISTGNFYIIRDTCEGLTLKRSHKYYYQVQLEMYCTGTSMCDFMVWTPREFVIVSVVSDECFVMEKVNVCDQLWKKVVLRELITRESENQVKRSTKTTGSKVSSSSLKKYCVNNCSSSETEMVGCDSCDNWYHPTCLNYKGLPKSKTWYCPQCKKLQKQKLI